MKNLSRVTKDHLRRAHPAIAARVAKICHVLKSCSCCIVDKSKLLAKVISRMYTIVWKIVAADTRRLNTCRWPAWMRKPSSLILSFLGDVVLEDAGGSQTITFEAQATDRQRALSIMVGGLWASAVDGSDEEKRMNKREEKKKYGSDRGEGGEVRKQPERKKIPAHSCLFLFTPRRVCSSH